MAGWYLPGVVAGVALALGVLGAGLVGGSRRGLILVGPAALLGAVAFGLVLTDGFGVPCAAVGVLAGVLVGSSVVHGARSRGGTATGTAGLVAFGAAVIAALSLVPLVGYVLTLAAPAFVWRRARRQPERFAGLRTLAE